MTKNEFKGRIQAIQWNNRIASNLLMLWFLVSIAIFLVIYLGPIFAVFAVFDPQGAEEFLSSTEGHLRIARYYFKILFFIGGTVVYFLYRDFKDAHILFNAAPLKLAHKHPFYQALENLCIARGLRVPGLYIINHMPAHFVTAIVLQSPDGRAKLMITPAVLELPQQLQDAFAAQAVQRLYSRDSLFLTMLCFFGYFPFHILDRSMKFVAIILKPFLAVTDWLMRPVRNAILNMRTAKLDAGSLTLTKEKGAMHDLVNALTPLSEIEKYYYEAYLPLFIARSDGPYRVRVLESA